jgi:hypothetical protein
MQNEKENENLDHEIDIFDSVREARSLKNINSKAHIIHGDMVTPEQSED